MARRKFTAKDLAPLRKLTARVVEKQPDAAIVAQAAQPFKRKIPTARLEERLEVALPVEIETSTNPGGVPVHEIAQALRKDFPGLRGLSVTPGGVTLKLDKAPTAAQRRKVEGLLADRTRLEALKPVVREAAAPGEAVGASVPKEELERVLAAPDTSDTTWIKAFRKYAVENDIVGKRASGPGPTRGGGE